MGISLAPSGSFEDKTAAADANQKQFDADKAAGKFKLAPTPNDGMVHSMGGSALSLAPSTAAPMTAAAPAVPAPTVAAPAAPVDRLKLATDNFNASAASTAPAYEAAARDEVRRSAALGQIASGGLRTRYGDLRLARERDLDTMRKDLVNKATEGSIADATTAYQQALASSQQGLANTIGLGNLELAQKGQEGSLDQNQQQIDLAKKTADIEAQFKAGTLTLAQKDQALRELSNSQQFGLSREQLALNEKLGLGGLSAEQRRVAIAEKEQAANEAYRNGTLTLAERDAALRELAQAQQNAVATGQLDLAREAQGDQSEIARERLALDERLGLAGLDAEARRTTIAERQQQAEAAYQAGQLTLGQRDAALRELAQAQQNTIQTGQLTLAQQTQTANQGNEAARLQLAREQLTQQGAQFGLSLAQQRDLAELADATQNRQLDISTAQGKNSLLLELARILGGTEGDLDPAFVQRIAQSLGFAMPGGATDVTTEGAATPDDVTDLPEDVAPVGEQGAGLSNDQRAQADGYIAQYGVDPNLAPMIYDMAANKGWDEVIAFLQSIGGQG